MIGAKSSCFYQYPSKDGMMFECVQCKSELDIVSTAKFSTKDCDMLGAMTVANVKCGRCSAQQLVSVGHGILYATVEKKKKH